MFGTYSIVYSNSPPLPPPPPSKPLLSPLPSPLNGLTPACLSGNPGTTLLQGFVQELIRCSRPSETVLQTTLRCIEVVCQKPLEIANALGESSKDNELAMPEPLGLSSAISD